MKKYLTTTLLVLSLLSCQMAAQAEVIIKNDFEAGSSPEGPEPKYIGHGDTFVGAAAKEDYEFAAGASKESEVAMVLTGGEEETHTWKPAIDFEFPSMKGGYLKISFKFRNASLDVGQCLLQIWGVDDQGEKEKRYAYLRITSSSVRASGTGQHMFKEVTSGVSSEWHEIVWTLPLPGTTDSETLMIDGDKYGDFKQPPAAGVVELTRMRFFLQVNKSADVQYAIDEILVEHIE